MEPDGRAGSERMSYLLDTDWTIQYLNGLDRFVERINDLEADGLYLSIISLGEVYEGVFGSFNPVAREEELDAFLEHAEVLSVDLEVARIFAAERSRLRREGLLFGDMDLLIAATALRHDLTLLTNNRRHFERIPSLAIESI